MRDDIFELELKEYEEFCLNASYSMWQETEIYGDGKEEDDESAFI